MKTKTMQTDQVKANTIVFTGVKPEPILELRADGDILVKGKFVENDKEVVDGMREFLKNRMFDVPKLSYDNPTPLDVVTNVHAMVMAHPNDSDLGGALRKYITSLREENKNE